MITAYIVGGGSDGTEEYSGVYHLVTADGCTWASYWCESFEQAQKELYDNRDAMKKDMLAKFGSVSVARLGTDEMTFDRLLERSMSFVPNQGKFPDGTYYSIITIKDGQWSKTEPRPIRDLGHAVVETLLNQQ